MAQNLGVKPGARVHIKFFLFQYFRQFLKFSVIQFCTYAFFLFSLFLCLLLIFFLHFFYLCLHEKNLLRADVSKYRTEVYKSEKSKILKKIHKVALGKLLT